MKIVTYRCDTCQREVEKEDDPRRVMALACNITYQCPGFLEPVSESSVRTELLPAPVSGVQDWSSRFESDSVDNEQQMIFFPVHSNDDGVLTVAIPTVYSGPTIELTLSPSTTTPSEWTEYSYTKPIGTKTISGVDDTGKSLSIQPGDRVRFVVGSVDMVDFSVVGSTIILNDPLPNKTNLIRVIVSTPSTRDQFAVTGVRHSQDMEIDSAWSNVDKVTITGVECVLYSITDVLTKIPTKTSMRVTGMKLGQYDYSAALSTVRILLSSPPYDHTGRVLDANVQLAQVTSLITQDDSTSVQVEKQVVKMVYPPILVKYNQLFVTPEPTKPASAVTTEQHPTSIV